MKKLFFAAALGLSALALVPATAQAAPNSSVILIDGKNFDGASAAEGLGGRGCQNVAQNNRASSAQPSGRVTLFDGRNCTGARLVLNGPVADLGRFGFDNRTSSVLFG